MSVDDLLAQILTLSAADRRRLFRRAQRMGLLTAHDLEGSDALESAAAAAPHPTEPPRASAVETPAKPPLPPAPARANAPVAPEAPRLIDLRPAPPVSAAPPARPAPRTQKPAAAKAAAAPAEIRVRVVFDGGSKGNPGQGYGSYALLWPGQAQPEIIRLTFGSRVTNNEAEYDTLINALQDLVGRVQAAGGAPAQLYADIWGDSQLVVNQVNGTWKINKAPLQARCNQVRALLQQFGFAALNYHPREESVALLGH